MDLLEPGRRDGVQGAGHISISRVRPRLHHDPKGREEPGREAFERAYRDLADPPAIRLERP